MNAAEPLPAEARRLASHSFVHGVMAQLHMVLACSGMTYADVAKKTGEREKTIRRMFWDYDFVANEPKAIRLTAYIACACGHQITFSLDRIPESPPTDVPAEQSS